MKTTYANPPNSFGSLARFARPSFKNDCRTISLRSAQAQSIQLLEIAETHEHDLKTSREANNREIESERASFEVERRRRVATYNSEIDELRGESHSVSARLDEDDHTRAMNPVKLPYRQLLSQIN